MEIGHIIKGHVNEFFGLNNDISLSRLNICYTCPLYSNRFGGLCSDDMWLNPDTREISTVKKDGYKRGCGCRLRAKTRLSSSICPLGKW